MAPTFTTSYSTLKRFLKPRSFGMRMWSGVWPPSNQGGIEPPARAFWPLVPRPAVLPLPAAFKKIARDINEDARDHARSLKGTPEFDRSSHERKKVEMRFAHLKVHHAFERMRLRGLTGARDEFHLGAIVQNLKTLANHMRRPTQSQPIACTA